MSKKSDKDDKSTDATSDPSASPAESESSTSNTSGSVATRRAGAVARAESAAAEAAARPAPEVSPVDPNPAPETLHALFTGPGTMPKTDKVVVIITDSNRAAETTVAIPVTDVGRRIFYAGRWHDHVDESITPGLEGVWRYTPID